MNRAILPLVASTLLLSACAITAPTPKATQLGATVTCSYRTSNAAAKPVDPPNSMNVPAAGTASVTLNFAGGPVEVTVDQTAAPCTAHSFESLAQQGFYNDTPCHRMSTGGGYYFLQCGDPTGTGTGGPGYWFDDELAQTKTYPKGTVAMANAGPNTNGSQFFIVYASSPFPANYTVFGRLDDAGIAVIEAIAKQGTDASEAPNAGRPLGDATIKSVTVG